MPSWKKSLNPGPPAVKSSEGHTSFVEKVMCDGHYVYKNSKPIQPKDDLILKKADRSNYHSKETTKPNATVLIIYLLNHSNI